MLRIKVRCPSLSALCLWTAGIQKLGIRKRDHVSSLGKEIQYLGSQMKISILNRVKNHSIMKRQKIFARNCFQNIWFFCENMPLKSKCSHDLLPSMTRSTSEVLCEWGQRIFPWSHPHFHTPVRPEHLSLQVTTLGWHCFHWMIKTANMCMNNQMLSTHV